MTHVEAALEPLGLAIKARLTELVDNSAGSREMYERRDAMVDFERKGPLWLKGTAKAWRDALVPPTETGLVRLAASLELIGDEVVERKILSSRLALAIIEKASWELNDLRVRMQHLEGGDDFASHRHHEARGLGPADGRAMGSGRDDPAGLGAGPGCDP